MSTGVRAAFTTHTTRDRTERPTNEKSKHNGNNPEYSHKHVLSKMEVNL